MKVVVTVKCLEDGKGVVGYVRFIGEDGKFVRSKKED